MESMFNHGTLIDPLVGEQVMSITDALMTFLFGVCLPSWDVYSDMGLAYHFLTERCHTFKPYLYYEKYLQWKTTKCSKEDSYKECIECPIIDNKTITSDGICDGFLYIPSFGCGIYGNDCGDWSDEEFCSGKK